MYACMYGESQLGKAAPIFNRTESGVPTKKRVIRKEETCRTLTHFQYLWKGHPFGYSQSHAITSEMSGATSCKCSRTRKTCRWPVL